MSENKDNIPLMQRILDNPFALLVAGLTVMIVFYTAWGLMEITNLPKSLLP